MTIDIFQKKVIPGSDESLLCDIRNLARQMEIAEAKFKFESDDDLVEATIYEIESLKARYRYLYKLAKERNMKSEDIGSLYVPSAS